MIADERDKARAASTQLKLALVANNPAIFLPLFFGDDPPMSSTPSTPQAVEREEVIDFDPAGDTEGVWEFTGDADPEEAQRLLMEMLVKTGGTVMMGDAGDWK